VTLSLIVAVSQNNVIGRAGGIPWRIPADMRHFRETTMGKPVIMGRRTWESLNGPLPGRTNIVITRNKGFVAERVLRAQRFEEALKQAQSLTPQPDEIVVIGGAGVYRLALPLADRIYLTRVHGDIPGDTFFPQLNPQEWTEVDQRFVPRNAKASHDCTIMTLERRSPGQDGTG